MIFTDRTIMVKNGTSSINDTIVLYRGDREVEIRFSLNEGSPFKFGSGSSPNIIEKTEATYGQLVIKTPGNLPPIFSEVAPTIGGKIIFTITAEMIDEITEVGNYTFQIRLLDDSMESRATLPEVKNGIEIREPIALEDISSTNEVEVAAVGYALTTVGTIEDAFDSQGNYNKTTWGTGDRITAAKLNKIEAGIDGVNKKVASGGTGGGVADSVDWSNVQNKPTIPTNTSQLTNDSGFITNIPDEYITETELNAKGYATEQYVDDAVRNASIIGGDGSGSNINDTTASSTTTYSSNKIENIKENLNSQIKDIAKYGMFNTDLGLAKFRICKNPKVVAFGDSITEGAGGLQRFDIWADRVKSYMALKYGLYGKGKTGIENVEGTIPSGWVFEAKGTNHSRYYSNENASNINIESRIKYSYKADIIYSTENDGGTFDVIKVSDNSIISSGNCNGNTSYGNKLTITNTSGNELEIRPNGKVYIECIVYYGYDGLTDGALFIRNGHGGVGLHDYTYDEINATVTKFNPDLTIMAMLVNDSQEQYFEDYKEKVRYTINEAKKTGDCLILINVQGYSYEDVERRKTWDKYKKFLYAIAIELNCALLDMDSFFGGYPNAFKNGFFLDDNIHPSSKGHMAISNLITKVLFPEALGLDIENEIIFSGSHGGFDIVSKDFKLPIQDTKELISVFDNGNGPTISFKDIVYNKYFDIRMWYNRLEFNSDVQRIQFETPIRMNRGAEFLGDFCRIPSSSPSNPYKGEIFVDNDNNKFKYVTNSKQRTSQPIQNGTARPTNPEIGEMFFDITLGKPIWCKQITPNIIWVDAIGSEV